MYKLLQKDENKKEEEKGYYLLKSRYNNDKEIEQLRTNDKIINLNFSRIN